MPAKSQALTSRVLSGAFAIVASGAIAITLAVPAAGSAANDNVASLQSAELSGSAHARQVAASLGADSGGVFLDAKGTAMIAVTNAADAATARAAGVTPKMVKYSLPALTAAKDSLDKVGGATNTSWGLDPATNRVEVTILDSASPATVAKVTKAAEALGDKASITRKHGRYQTYIAGGDEISNGSVICSNGFNVNQNGQNFLLTAGHCTATGGTWNGADMSGGQIVHSDTSGVDSGLITNPNGSAPGQVNNGQHLSSAGTPPVGQNMSKSGRTTGTTDGNVTGVDQTVNFEGLGEIQHMTGAALHSDHGDSGGTGYSGEQGVGTLSGGDGTTTFFYPLQRELDAYGVALNS